MPEKAIWMCKIGEAEREGLPEGADGPMRYAVEEAFRKTTGSNAEFCFSGWGEELTENERAVVEDRRPDRTEVSAAMPDQVVDTLVGCARCGKTHLQLTFKPLTLPIEEVQNINWTHWCLCPYNGEPILLRNVDD